MSTLPLLPACSDDAAAEGDYLDGGTGYADEGGDGDGDGDGDEPSEEEEEETGDGDGDEEPMCNDVDDVVLYLSPDDSNSMSSPVQIRERVLIDDASSISGVPVRVWELMNYYTFPYPPAEDGQLALHAAMVAVEGETSTWALQLAVSSEVMTPEERPAMNVTLVLDTSGSMEGEPIELLKATSRVIASQLQQGDTVSVCEWDTENVWTLGGYAVTGPNDPTVLDVIDAVAAGGGTDLNGGLVSGYQLAQEVFDIEMLNRLVLISDGGANAGVTDVELIAQNAAYGGSDGIYLVGVGVGDSGYNDRLMDDVTDAGKGASVFIPDAAEAEKVFGDQFENTMAVAGREVQVELTMPPGFEIVKFSGEEFSGDPTEIEPQHIAPNDAMVFHQQVRTCAPELVDDAAEFTITASWTDPSTFESKQVTQTWAYAELTGADPSLLRKGAAVLAYGDALQLLRQGDPSGVQPALDAIAAAQMLLDGDADLEEMAAILDRLSN
ncbi:MAG TPA: VWA domain-containing protein [Enhygromyxa sp.]|nr:VWA domain-containing protein [Enhygromyxa sp.]